MTARDTGEVWRLDGLPPPFDDRLAEAAAQAARVVVDAAFRGRWPGIPSECPEWQSVLGLATAAAGGVAEGEALGAALVASYQAKRLASMFLWQ